MNTTQKRGIIVSFLENPAYKDYSYTNLARVILEQYPSLSRSLQVLRKTISEVAKELIPNVEIQIEQESEPFTVDGTNYTFNAKKGVFSFSVDFIDNLFYEFSEKGLNLSSTEVMNKHGLEPFQWHHIKFVLNLYKKSHIFSPYTVQNTPPERLGEMIEQKMDKLWSSVQYQVEKTYEKTLLKKHRKELEKYETRNLEVNTIVSELYELLPKCKVTLQYNTCTEVKQGPVVIHIADIHFGAENDGSNYMLPIYSPEKTKEYLYKIAQQVNLLKASEVHICFAGDAIESFSGMNHNNSWKNLARGHFGAKVVIECYKLLSEFISSVNNIKAFYAIGGNHDRTESSKNLETSEGFAGQLIFEFLALSFKDKVDVVFDSTLISQEIDGINYIISHGDKKITDLSPADLILDYGEPRLYNLLVSGHWHERKVKKDTKNFRQIVCPSIFPGNDYSVNLGYSTAPGFLISYNNGNGKPTIIDYCL